MEEPKLTAVIAFRNEGVEVENTIKSLLSKSEKDIKILLVDDQSDDGYDYKSVADKYHCDYHIMDKRSGSAGAKHWGGMNVTTPYFCFFDAHMRVYHNHWDTRLVRLLEEHPNSIISSRTVYISQNKDGSLKNEDGKEGNGIAGLSYCCYMIEDGKFAFDPKWTDKCMDRESELSRVSCVLGACYGISKSWWQYIRGFEGIVSYGLEESYMSLKTWMLGGECYVVTDWGVGHIYRSVNPNGIKPYEIDANRLALIRIFSYNENYDCSELKKRIGETSYNNAYKIFEENKSTIQKMKEYIHANKVRDYNWFKENINKYVKM